MAFYWMPCSTKTLFRSILEYIEGRIQHHMPELYTNIPVSISICQPSMFQRFFTMPLQVSYKRMNHKPFPLHSRTSCFIIIQTISVYLYAVSLRTRFVITVFYSKPLRKVSLIFASNVFFVDIFSCELCKCF